MERIRSFFKKIGKLLNSKGYTLMEVAAVVAVTGTLAAVAMPVIIDKLGQSKITAATQDVQAIRDAIVLFVKDTGIPPFYTALAADTVITLPSVSDATANYYYALKTDDGLAPSYATSGTTATWPAFATSGAGSTGSLDGQLIINSPVYPTKSSNAWKGPYLPSLKKDPWGKSYLVAIKGLAQSDIKYAVFAISAGPNGKIETGFEQSIRKDNASTGTGGSFTPGGDDIISRIQ